MEKIQLLIRAETDGWKTASRTIRCIRVWITAIYRFKSVHSEGPRVWQVCMHCRPAAAVHGKLSPSQISTEKGIASEQLFTIHADTCRPSIFDIFAIGSSHLSPGTACLFFLLTSWQARRTNLMKKSSIMQILPACHLAHSGYNQ